MKSSMCIILWKKIIVYMVSGIFMVIVVFLLKNVTSSRLVNLMIQIIFGVLIYMGCIFIVDKETFLDLLNYIKKRVN